MTREELFKKAKEARKEEKENEGKKGNFQFDDIKWSPLVNGAYKVYRLLGNPIDNRMGDKFSPKVVNTSKIVGDNGKQFKVNWKDDENWILHRIYDKVMSYTWDKTSQTRVYHNQKKYPEIFNRVFKNGKMDNAYESGWKPKKVVLINAIDRDLMDWHKENKKTCLISRNASEGEGTIYYDFGFPLTAYNKIFDEVVSYAGDWESYDILVKRLSDDPYYKVFHASDDYKKFAEEMKSVKGTLDYADRPLTEEELSWERWDIDKYSTVTSYKKIHNRLKLFIQEVDATLRTNFYPELEALVEKEDQAKKEAETDEDDEEVAEESAPAEVKKPATSSGIFKSDSEIESESKVTEAKAPARARKEVEPSPSVNIDDLTKAGFKGLQFLSKDNLKHILGFDGTSFKYAKEAGACYACVDDACAFPAPESFSHCPKCGTKFE